MRRIFLLVSGKLPFGSLSSINARMSNSTTITTANAGRGRPRKTRTRATDDIQGVSFHELQAELLAPQAKIAQRAPGRARVDRIIETAIELLAEHSRADISIAMIASEAGMTRTSVYAHFNNIGEVFEQIAVRFIQQVGVFVERYVRERNPTSLSDVVTLTIDAIQHHFNRPDPDAPGALAAHVPFDARHLIKEFDRVSALTYHSLWKTNWPIEPLSDDDPFRMLVTLQSAIFDLSIQRHGKITDELAQEAKLVALDYIQRTDRRFNGPSADSGLIGTEQVAAVLSQLAQARNPRLLTVAVAQLEALASLAKDRPA